jgi:hypothetical protein
LLEEIAFKHLLSPTNVQYKNKEPNTVARSSLSQNGSFKLKGDKAKFFDKKIQKREIFL